MAKKNDGQGQVRKRGDYVSVFSSDVGNRVIADLMTTFHWGRSSHSPGDPYETAFREGERHVILHILNSIGKRGDIEWINDRLDSGTIEYSPVQEFTHV